MLKSDAHHTDKTGRSVPLEGPCELRGTMGVGKERGRGQSYRPGGYR